MIPARCKTVGELKAALRDIPNHIRLKAIGPDEGGYDWEDKEALLVTPTNDDKLLLVGSNGEDDQTDKLVRKP